jgi:hypothetical protein
VSKAKWLTIACLVQLKMTDFFALFRHHSNPKKALPDNHEKTAKSSANQVWFIADQGAGNTG